MSLGAIPEARSSTFKLVYFRSSPFDFNQEVPSPVTDDEGTRRDFAGAGYVDKIESESVMGRRRIIVTVKHYWAQSINERGEVQAVDYRPETGRAVALVKGGAR